VKPNHPAIETRLEFIRQGKWSEASAGGSEAATPLINDAPVLSSIPQEKYMRERQGPIITAVMEEAAPVGTSPGPGEPEARPRSLAELGIRQSIADDLATKTLYMGSTLSTRELATQMRVSVNVADELVNRMRNVQLCQVMGMAGNLPTISLTDAGRKRGMELLAQSQYLGAAPVSLESYVKQVRKQSVRKVVVRRADVERAFGDLVIDSKVLGQIGMGLNSGATIFVHGPAGVGKTAIAETMSRVLAEDNIWIPYAVEVDGQMISLFDPMIHKRVNTPEAENCDERWVRCERPSVLVGGELTIDMLDLQFNASTKFYTGPVQMKANNGVLIVDDFGRQRVRPEELLNRWVVPLDRGIDFLTMAGGRKIEVPFEMLVVFSTNLDPADLVDAAFLRRMQTKIRVDTATDDQFRQIFRRVAARRGLAVDEAVLSDLIVVLRQGLRQELRACQPRDLVNQVCWAAQYEDRRPTLDAPSLMAAVEAYFLVPERQKAANSGQ
jgi:energy-coupling factor transporter ATP-binding protein EcfA2